MTSTNQVIPAEAVEAVARLLPSQSGERHYGESPELDAEYRRDARELLEAAAPHMLNRARVTTEEELDALPVGAVVLSDSYTYGGEGCDWPVSFQKWPDGYWHRGARSGSTHPDNFLPALILHRPAP